MQPRMPWQWGKYWSTRFAASPMRGSPSQSLMCFTKYLSVVISAETYLARPVKPAIRGPQRPRLSGPVPATYHAKSRLNEINVAWEPSQEVTVVEPSIGLCILGDHNHASLPWRRICV